MWPLSAVQFSPVTRPCYLRSCPNGPRFDQREITRMMSLLAHSVVRCIAAPTVAIGDKADMPNEFLANLKR
jgi:hypothetical protein